MSTELESVVAALSLDHQLLTPQQAKALVEESRAGSRSLTTLLLERIAETDILRAIARELGIVFYDLYSTTQLYRVDDELLEKADVTYLKRFSALPMLDREDKVVIAIAFPDVEMGDYLNRKYPGHACVLSSRGQIQDKLAYFSSDSAAASLAEDRLGTSTFTPGFTYKDNLPKSTGPKNPVVEFVDATLARAVAAGASDVHLQFAHDKSLVIRFRTDGVLRRHRVNLAGREMEVIGTVLSKAESMDSSNMREPQDGTFTFEAAGRQIDARVSMLPQINGPKVVIRLLDSRNMRTRLDDMGFSPDHLAIMRHATQKSQGTILVSGPTGSGKSTTLYSLIKEVDAETKNVVTVEDPVEYKLPGIGQTPIRSDLGNRSLTFPRALRSILRQDPDIILVGEVRDDETARVAMDAAITGHLVLSTIHAPSAIGVYTRLMEMGIPPYMVAQALTLSIAQLLIRRVHECARMEVPTQDEKAWFHELGVIAPDRVAHVTGCTGCSGTGYRGRLAVVEVLEPSSAFKTLVSNRATYEDLHAQALADGFRPMRDDGLRHVLAGATTVSEAVRILAAMMEE